MLGLKNQGSPIVKGKLCSPLNFYALRYQYFEIAMTHLLHEVD